MGRKVGLCDSEGCGLEVRAPSSDLEAWITSYSSVFKILTTGLNVSVSKRILTAHIEIN